MPLILFLMLLPFHSRSETPIPCYDQINSFYNFSAMPDEKLIHSEFSGSIQLPKDQQEMGFTFNKEIDPKLENDHKYQAARFEYWLKKQGLWTEGGKIHVVTTHYSKRLMIYENPNSGMLFTDFGDFRSPTTYDVKDKVGNYNYERKIVPYPLQHKKCEFPKEFVVECQKAPRSARSMYLYENEYTDISKRNSFVSEFNGRCHRVEGTEVFFYPTVLNPVLPGYAKIEDAINKTRKGSGITVLCRCKDSKWESYAQTGLKHCSGIDTNYGLQVVQRLQNSVVYQSTNKDYVIGVINGSKGFQRQCEIESKKSTLPTVATPAPAKKIKEEPGAN